MLDLDDYGGDVICSRLVLEPVLISFYHKCHCPVLRILVLGDLHCQHNKSHIFHTAYRIMPHPQSMPALNKSIQEDPYLDIPGLKRTNGYHANGT